MRKGDEARYDSLFRQSRAVSALAFALSREPDEAIYEAAYAVGTAEDLLRGLTSWTVHGFTWAVLGSNQYPQLVDSGRRQGRPAPISGFS